MGQGSRVLAPNYPDTSGLVAPGPTNNDFSWLEHDAFGGASDNFLDPGAPASDRLFIYLRNGETLRFGIRRIPVKYDATDGYNQAPHETTFAAGGSVGNNQDLSVILYDNAGSIVQASYYEANPAVDNGAAFVTTNGAGRAGIIESPANGLLGPEFTFNSITYNTGGYTPIEYTNNTGTDQAFYIAFLQDNYTFTTEAQLIIDINAAAIADIDIRSWYDLWDFTVYSGLEEKTGRVYCQRWNFTAQYLTNRLADEFQMYVRVPSTVAGTNAGNYIKQLDIGGIDPFSLILYANSEGSDGTGGDTNGDGSTDFQDHRQGQVDDYGFEEYDIFIQNPDIDIWPTTTLPSVDITDAIIYCNATGNGGEASITIETNQVGYAAVIIDLNGVGGYQAGTTDVIIEAEITTTGSQTIRWDGLDGTGAAVLSGTPLTISGRFTSGPLHVPMFDVEESAVGINMIDVRPSTSFDLIYWDDSSLGNTGASPESELDGTNIDTHLWNDDGGNNGGDNNLINTWSFGYYQVNTQNVNFTYACDTDGDGVVGTADLDSDNDGVSDAVEGDFQADADGDNIPNYIDADFAGYVDSNADGINDNFDTDLDGVPDALDADSDNDGIPDLVENGLTDANLDGTLDEGSGITDANNNGLADEYDAACNAGLFSGNGTAEPVRTSIGGFGNAPMNAIGAVDGGFSTLDDVGDVLVVDMGIVVPSGETIDIRWGTGTLSNVLTVDQGTVSTGPFTNPYTSNFTGTGAAGANNENYVLTADAQFLRFRLTTDNGTLSGVDAISYSFTGPNPCGATTGTAITPTDTDGDGVDNFLDLDSDNDGIVDVIEAGGSANSANGQIANFTDVNGNGLNDDQEEIALTLPDSDGDGTFLDYLDIDSDNDGILDNVDGQDSESSIVTAAGDTDGNGLLDVYDPNNGGTLLVPVDTDSDGTSDHLSIDADGDGVLDYIEGWDSDRDGFSNLDTNEDGVITDETGYNADADSDGLWDIFEAGTAPVPNTDGSGKSNWQDTDDDNDGILTSGEDSNNNGNWTDDKTQGQGASADVPDYLYRGDYDGDSIPDSADADSDNDGILDSEEDNGETIDPSGDEDGDGIANYQDTSDATVTSGLSSTADVNGDGVYDVYDTDFDGIPDFLDLDSDNDGIWDAIEADGGSVPNGLNTTTGQFALQDPDNDGLMNYVDTDDVTSGGVSDLANPDSDGDGIRDYIDIDSDGDGVTDIIEAQSQSGFIALTNLDSDGDGIDNAFDVSDGGVLIDPINSDGLDLRDYLDTDSDNDTVLDINEGDDANQDGYGDWDSDFDHDITDEAGYNTDADGDGLADIFDTVTAGTAGNETGSNADLPNTDAIDLRNWRDSDDDNDGTSTADEDANNNGNLADDQTGGQAGNIPDYLYYGDYDGDGIPDASDGDSDNDGIPDSDEDGGEVVDPSADADGDGIPNYRDSDDPGLSSTVDSNGDGVYDVYDTDLDGIPDFRDRDSDNDGTPDLLEAGGTDADGDGEVDGNTDTDGDGIPDSVDVTQTGGVDSDGDGIDDAFDFSVSGGTDTDGDDIIDSADLDIDGDGILNAYDADNGGTPITLVDSDGDGLVDIYDLDSDNDGITDLVESGGTDVDGDGKLDDLTDTDLDGFPDLIDSDNGGTPLTRPDTDNDGILDFLDVDSDNDGIPDTVDNGGEDSNNDGRIDSFATDTDGDGLADAVDPDSGGTPISNIDTDGDGISDYLDLDADNDGYPDILEAGGTDADNDGVVDNTLNSDPLEDTIPDNVDVDQTGGTDSDGDEIDDAFDIDFTGGTDTDGDGIDDAFDTDANGDGFDDGAKANPYGQEDKESDGFKDFRDLDSDGDGIVDVIEMGFTADVTTGQIAGFTDANNNGWNDAQEGTVITPTDTDSDGFPDYQDIDADNDGLPDNIEGQTKATYAAISNIDTDNDGLDDAYDPDNGGTFISPPSTDGGDADYLDTDADGDSVPDNIEGNNDDRSQYADWDTNSNNDITDETGYNVDTDSDGLWDVFDTNAGNTSANVTSSTSNGMDTDNDGIWDFQDVDDDGDGTNTSAEDTGTVDGDPTNDFAQGGTPIPDYLYGDQDPDGDGVNNNSDLDSDNDGLPDADEDGSTGIDPSGDIDNDGVRNFEDPDMDGDSIVNSADTDGDGSGTNTTGFTDTNGDGVIDQFDKDLDGVPDFLDLDSDNDGIADIIEFGLTDANEDGTLDEGAGITDTNGNGLDDSSEGGTYGNAVAVQDENSIGNSANAIGGDDANRAAINAVGDYLILDLGASYPSGTVITINARDSDGGTNVLGVAQSTDGVDGNETNSTTLPGFASNLEENKTFTLNASARYIHLYMVTDGGAGSLQIDAIQFNNGFTPTASCVGEGNATAIESESGINNSGNAIGFYSNDGARAAMNNVGEYLILDMGQTLPSGLVITINSRVTGSTGNILAVGQSTIGGNGNESNVQVIAAFAAVDTEEDKTYTLSGDARYIHILMDADGGSGAIQIDAVSYDAMCTTTGIMIPDSDSDGIADHLDLDSDNDGIPDNIEAQPTVGYVAPAAGDSDGDGILDVYDEDIAVGNAIDPENTDGADSDDYIDTDSDNDGVLDFVEAFDANMDGFSSLDTDRDGLISDQSGYSSDSDQDGIRLILDTSNGRGTIANITGTSAQRQDTDGDGIEDWRDIDDDGDGVNTNTTGAAGEDANSNGNWADDFTQGGGTSPNYLYNPDVDGDGVADNVDLDSDQDGVLNTVEYAGAVYAAGGGPFDDNDGDGIYNYLDTNDAGNTSFTDVNGDGIDDQVDQDRDGIPNFFDLDSDNDGIMDAIEANDGVVPTGFNTATGRFGVNNSGGDDDDDDNDGLNDNVDTDSGGSVLPNSNTDAADGDSLSDFLDLDSDNDGITDHIEGQTTVALINPSGLDTDGDGLDDAFDGNNGGDAITPTNTDGTDNPDYRDTDSDNDNDGDGVLLDVIEGYDANRNGYSELDTDLDGLLTDEVGYNVDSDNDGLWDLFDSFSGRGNSNTLGSKANLQDTDNDGRKDFRDQDDDGDALTTAVEDGDNDGDWTNDKTQGGGATPDYLYFNDTDGDRIADGQDQDGDNDGILDDDEYDATTYRDPFGDQDGDGIFNYNDLDDPTDLGGSPLVDSNGDGIWDAYDWDLDGTPNFFDLDSDNDGIPDILEAGGVDADNDGKLDGTTDTDGDGIFDNVDVDETGGTDADLDGIDDTFQDGSDTDGDGIEDTADLDIDGDGIINSIDADNGGTPLSNPDTDGDGIRNMFDFDSDNDGILDIIEAGGADSNGDGKLDSFGDTDGDGWGNSVDSDNGGTAHPMHDSDSDLTEDYIQIDADSEGTSDWAEGFDDDEDGDYLDDYESRRSTYETANGSPGHYPTTDTGPANGTPDYLDDADSDGTPNFLDPDNGTYYRDTDSDGIVDFFDPDSNGTRYAGVSGAPDNDGDGLPNYRDDSFAAPLPLDWLSFEATYVKGDVDLVWITANEVDVSHFEIEHSIDGESFRVIDRLEANNLSGVNTYTHTHLSPVIGINYYRVNQVDFDGKSDYSWIRVVTAANNKISFVVYPNPTEEMITVQSEAIVTGSVQLIDVQGRTLTIKDFKGTNRTTIDLTDLKTGIYQLRITTPNGVVYRRVVKK